MNLFQEEASRTRNSGDKEFKMPPGMSFAVATLLLLLGAAIRVASEAEAEAQAPLGARTNGGKNIASLTIVWC